MSNAETTVDDIKVFLGWGIVATFPSEESSEAEAYAKSIGGAIVKDFQAWAALVLEDAKRRTKDNDVECLVGDENTMREIGYDRNLDPTVYVDNCFDRKGAPMSEEMVENLEADGDSIQWADGIISSLQKQGIAIVQATQSAHMADETRDSV